MSSKLSAATKRAFHLSRESFRRMRQDKASIKAHMAWHVDVKGMPPMTYILKRHYLKPMAAALNDAPILLMATRAPKSPRSATPGKSMGIPVRMTRSPTIPTGTVPSTPGGYRPGYVAKDIDRGH